MTLQLATLALSVHIIVGSHAIDPVLPSTELAHVRNTSQFEISAPVGRAAPLFGPDAERCWAGKHWNPEFLYPRTAKDIQGAVFQVQHGQHANVWVNTLFDLPGGRIEYVSFIDAIFVTTLDIKVTSMGTSNTKVEVTSTRTALQPAANEDVRALGASDRDGGPDSQRRIEKCLVIEPK